jgi:biopolymer transport protein TolR
MIDIMLVLLIIFMIVTPMIANGFKATMPAAENHEKRPEGKNEVVLGIDAGGGYFLNGVGIPVAALEDHLRSEFSARSEDKVLYFRADRDLVFGKVQEAVETARKAGVAVMSAITTPKPIKL